MSYAQCGTATNMLHHDNLGGTLKTIFDKVCGSRSETLPLRNFLSKKKKFANQNALGGLLYLKNGWFYISPTFDELGSFKDFLAQNGTHVYRSLVKSSQFGRYIPVCLNFHSPPKIQESHRENWISFWLFIFGCCAFSMWSHKHMHDAIGFVFLLNLKI